MSEGGAGETVAGNTGEAVDGGEWMKVAGLDQCPPGTLLSVQAGDEALVLANVEGDLYALQDRCSHEDLPLSDGELDGDRLECLYHGATFDVCTGNAMALPAVRPVETYAVEVRGPDIYVQI
jgi:3-phenylpropionate/trans-cinnamate dioxygenase ferredoxin subunit